MTAREGREGQIPGQVAHITGWTRRRGGRDDVKRRRGRCEGEAPSSSHVEGRGEAPPSSRQCVEGGGG